MASPRDLLLDEMMPLEQPLSIEEGRALIYGGLGKYELELVISFCAPLAWSVSRMETFAR
jgi:hypothetical protein